MKKLSILAVVAVVALALAGAVFAGDVSGTVSAVDAKANTITVKTDKGDVTVNVTADTKIMVGTAAKAIADVKVGDKVSVKTAEKKAKPAVGC